MLLVRESSAKRQAFLVSFGFGVRVVGCTVVAFWTLGCVVALNANAFVHCVYFNSNLKKRIFYVGLWSFDIRF